MAHQTEIDFRRACREILSLHSHVTVYRNLHIEKHLGLCVCRSRKESFACRYGHIAGRLEIYSVDIHLPVCTGRSQTIIIFQSHNGLSVYLAQGKPLTGESVCQSYLQIRRESKSQTFLQNHAFRIAFCLQSQHHIVMLNIVGIFQINHIFGNVIVLQLPLRIQILDSHCRSFSLNQHIRGKGQHF